MHVVQLAGGIIGIGLSSYALTQKQLATLTTHFSDSHWQQLTCKLDPDGRESVPGSPKEAALCIPQKTDFYGNFTLGLAPKALCMVLKKRGLEEVYIAMLADGSERRFTCSQTP